MGSIQEILNKWIRTIMIINKINLKEKNFVRLIFLKIELKKYYFSEGVTDDTIHYLSQNIGGLKDLTSLAIFSEY